MPLLEPEGVCWEYRAFEDALLHDVIYTRGNHLRKTWHMLRALAKRVRGLRDLRHFDVVFIYEEAARVGPAILERLIKSQGLPIVYDFCDPIYLPYASPTNRYFSYLKFFGKTKTICRLASQVIVGNPLLAEWAGSYSQAVSVVPITIDTAAYQPRTWRQLQPDEIPTIGWSGSHSTVPHLSTLRAPLQELSRRRKFRLCLLGVRDYDLPGVAVDARPWDPRREVEDVRAFDIGVMPLPSDAWTLRRTHLKIRQYMGLGVPVVASPVGVNADLVRDGANGLLAESSTEWVNKLTRLLDDYDLRRSLGEAGRRTAEERFAARVWAPRVLEVLRAAALSR